MLSWMRVNELLLYIGYHIMFVSGMLQELTVLTGDALGRLLL